MIKLDGERKISTVVRTRKLVPRRKSRTTSGNGSRHLPPSPINSQPNRPRLPATSSASSTASVWPTSVRFFPFYSPSFTDIYPSTIFSPLAYFCRSSPRGIKRNKIRRRTSDREIRENKGCASLVVDKLRNFIISG